MALDPTIRSAGLHFGTAFSAVTATALWMSSHQVDLYAVMDQLNIVIREAAKLITIAGALATGAYQVWTSTTKGLVADVNEKAKDPTEPVKAVITTNTPEGKALAASLPGPVVFAGSDQAERLAKP